MTETIITALIASVIPLIGTIITNLSTHSKTMYRIEQLEKKQDLHNSVIARMYKAEQDILLLDQREKVSEHRIDDLEKKS